VLPEVDGKPSEVSTVEAALQGARDILSEQVAEDALIRGWVREITRAKGVVKSSVMTGKASDESKFKDYFDYSESLGTIPSHRMLAIRRGETEGELMWRVEAPVEEINARIAREVTGTRKASQQLTLVAADAYKRLLSPAIEVELRVELKTRADDEAITIFGRNLEQLLLSSPARRVRWCTPTRCICIKKTGLPGRSGCCCSASRRSSSRSAMALPAAKRRTSPRPRCVSSTHRWVVSGRRWWS
jgi:uncharacterized protein